MNEKNKSKKTELIVISLVTLTVLAMLVLAAFFLMRHMLTAAEQYYRDNYIVFSMNSEDYDYTESTGLLSGSGGYFYLRGYTLSDELSMDELSTTLSNHISDSRDEQLVLLEINLNRYSNCALSDTALRQTDTILSAWQDAGFQMILRFLYDWNGTADASEPDDLATVKDHMTSLAPTVNQYADAIYCMQGVFVGNCAEMNGGHFSDWASVRELMACLDSVIDPEIFLSVRTPAQRRMLLASEEIFPEGSTLAARLGLFNDGMLGSETDYGTYSTTDRAETDLGLAWLRAQELDYQDELCRKVPNGGEAVVDNPYNDAENAIADLSKMHVSYLSRMHHAEVLEKWKNSTVTTDDVWSGQDAYTYIGAHLGSRYRCKGVTLTDLDDDKKTASLTLTWCNTGFAPSYSPLTLNVQIVNEQGETVAQTSYDNDELTTVCSGEDVTISLPLELSGYAQGTYRILLSCETEDGTVLEQASLLPQTDGAYQVADFTVDRTPSSIPSKEELLRAYLAYKKSSSGSE